MRRLVREANLSLPAGVNRLLRLARQTDKNPLAQDALRVIQENIKIAQRQNIPLCQDCGLALFKVECGEEVRISRGSLNACLQRVVREEYTGNYLRCSVVSDPFHRKNTGDNTPAFIHYECVPGRKLKINFLAKGGGAENKSRLAMLSPAKGRAGIEEFIIETMRQGAADACPPLFIGIGIGGDFTTVAWLAKKALFRQPGSSHPDSFYAGWEKNILEQINQLGIGPQGWGGKTTALSVQIEVAPCHIASLPVAVNVQCHLHRWGEVIL